MYYIRLAFNNRRSDNELAQRYLDSARSIKAYVQHSSVSHIINATQGNIYEVANSFDSAVYYYRKVLEDIGGDIQDSSFVATQHYDLANTLRKWNKSEEAIHHLLMSKDIALKSGDDFRVGAVDVNLGIIYKNSGQYDQAVTYYNNAYEIYKRLDDYDNMATCVLNIANVLGRQGKHNEALRKYDEVYQLALKLDNNEGLLAFVYGNMANAYTQLNQHRNSLKYNRLAYDLRISRSDVVEKATSLVGMAVSHKDLNEPLQAIALLEEAKQITEHADGTLEVKQRINEALFLLYRNENRLNEAIEALSNYTTLKDSIRNIEIEKKVIELNEQLEVERKENEIVLLNSENELAANKLATARLQTYGLLAGLLIFATLLFLVARLYRKTQVQNKVISKALSEKETLLREIHHRVKNNLQFISSLLGLQTEHIEDKVALGALQEGQDRVQSMALIHQNLYQEDNLTGVDMKDYFVKLIQGLFDSYNIRKDQIKLLLDIEDLNLDVDSVIPIGLIVNELVSNCLKYAFPDKRKGIINVSLLESNDALVVTVKDDGIGISEEMKGKLGQSFGYRLVNVFKDQLRGELTINNRNGTEVTMQIKKYDKV